MSTTGKRNESREVPPNEPGLVTHTPAGTIVSHGGAGTAYSAYGCRCRACKNANALRVNQRRKEREALVKGEGLPETVRHGRASSYSNWGCRCEACSKAHMEKCNGYYTQKLSAEARRESNRESWDDGYSTAKKGGKRKSNPHA